MTQQEINILRNEIISQIELEAKQIEALTPVSALKDTDLLELNGGRRVSLKQLREFGVAIDALFDHFISKTRDDRTPFSLNIGGTLTAEQMLTIGKFVAGVSGANVDERGNAEFESGIFRSFLQIYELIVNRQRNFDSDVFFTEGDTAETVTAAGVSDEGNPKYTIKVHEEWEGYTTAMYEHDVLRGVYNDITKHTADTDGETTANNATYATCWMRVLDVRPFQNEIDVVLYPDTDTPAGRNFPPQPMMKFIRWGNAGASEACLKRQNLFFISSGDGRLSKYYHVTKPIIGLENIAVTVGTLPEAVQNSDPRLKGVKDGGYFDTLAVQNIIKVNHQGLPDPEIVFRGEYDPAETYYDGKTLVESNNKYEWSVVLYYGCQYLCQKTGTKNPPSWDSADWTLYSGDPQVHVYWATASSFAHYRDHDLKEELVAYAKVQNMDITDDGKVHWRWERESWFGEVRDTVADEAWNAAHASGYRNSLTFTYADCNVKSGGKWPDKVVITVWATLYDGDGNPMYIQGARGERKLNTDSAYNTYNP